MKKKFIGFVLVIGMLVLFTQQIFADNVVEDVSSEEWNGEIAASFSYGDGTKDNPYQISTASELALLAKNVNENVEGYNTAYYCLTSDIDLNNINWLPIGISDLSYAIDESKSFKGTFWGQGYSIKNLNISSVDTNYAGLFGSVVNATIDGLYITTAQINITSTPSTHTLYCGLLLGISKNSQLCNCHTSGIINIQTSDASDIEVGGMSGYQDGKVTYSSATASVNVHSYSAMGYCGGLSGSVSGEICDCYSFGLLDVEICSIKAGGLIGYTNSDVKNSFSMVDVHGTCRYFQYGNSCAVGGLVGEMGRDNCIEQCYANGNVEAKNSYGTAYAGGLVGVQSRKLEIYHYIIYNCFCTGDVSATGKNLSSSCAAAIIGGVSEKITIYSQSRLFAYCYYNTNAEIMCDSYYSSSNEIGESESIEKFKSKSWLERTLSFDFNNVWEMLDTPFFPLLIGGIPYRVLPYRIDALLVDDNIITVTATKLLDEKGILLVALYSTDGVLLDSEIRTLNISLHKTDDIVLNCNINQVDTVKAFIWNSEKDIQPLANKIEKDL